jgi:hypothetical protein
LYKYIIGKFENATVSPYNKGADETFAQIIGAIGQQRRQADFLSPSLAVGCCESLG